MSESRDIQVKTEPQRSQKRTSKRLTGDSKSSSVASHTKTRSEEDDQNVLEKPGSYVADHQVVAENSPMEKKTVPSLEQTEPTAKGGTMKNKLKAKSSRKPDELSASIAEEETSVAEVQEDNSFDVVEEDEDGLSSESPEELDKKGGKRRQSSPRGRRAVRFDPEDYVYNRLLIYTDGAARGNPGESGAGVVLKTPEGEEVGRFGRYLGQGTNNYAEYHALLLGLQHAQEFGASDITILSDSDLLVRQLSGEYRVRASHLRVLFEEAQKKLGEFEKYQIKRIERDKNKEADSMANRAIDERL